MEAPRRPLHPAVAAAVQRQYQLPVSVVVEVWCEISALRRSKGSCPCSPPNATANARPQKVRELHGAGVREVGGAETVYRNTCSVSRRPISASRSAPACAVLWQRRGMRLKLTLEVACAGSQHSRKFRVYVSLWPRLGGQRWPQCPLRPRGTQDRMTGRTRRLCFIDQSTGIGQVRDISGTGQGHIRAFKALYIDFFICSISLWTSPLG